MRVATARVASRRGSSITILPPRNHGSSSSAIGTTVLLPAPGGASTTALRLRCSAARSAGRISSMGRPDFTRPRIIPRVPLLTSAACAGAKQRESERRGLPRPPHRWRWRRHEVRRRWHLVAIVAAYFLGIDPRLIMGLLGGGAGAPQAEAPVEAGAPDDEGGQFVSHVLGDTEETWTAIFAQAGRAVSRAAPRAVFDEGINTGCGSATSAAGPFYCPPDQQGVHRPRVLPAARNRIRRAG